MTQKLIAILGEPHVSETLKQKLADAKNICTGRDFNPFTEHKYIIVLGKENAKEMEFLADYESIFSALKFNFCDTSQLLVEVFMHKTFKNTITTFPDRMAKLK